MNPFVMVLCLIPLRLINIWAVLSQIPYWLLRFDNSSNHIKKTKRTAILWKRLTGICFWDMKSSKKQQVRLSICVQTIAVVAWGGTLIMAFFYSINEPFQDVFLKILKVSLGFDLTSMYFGGLYTVYLCRQLGKRHK